ncbi:alpha-2-macroglobulin-like [Gracilinanus agilis]|uniref:alpha-2-macroglobulin-like n=1 Tax=Gracilinanus agilis TaxID=191870 RepID=UPI001CFD7EB2|nr:alpha-2-macroglobulin-like [Gracilinanus agilis]
MGRDRLLHAGLVLWLLTLVTAIHGEPTLKTASVGKTENLCGIWRVIGSGKNAEIVPACLESYFMVLVPSLLHTEITQKACVFISHLNESVTVTATLEFTRTNGSTIFTQQVNTQEAFLCLPFTIPRLSSSSEVAFLTVQVSSSIATVSKRKTVLVKNSRSLVFMQTDKPIYKPGQQVQFRIVAVDENFHIQNEMFPLVYIEDPQKNRIMQWQNLKLERGLTQQSFTLSSEPIYGSYKVVVEKKSGRKISRFFKVDEYVLPKFEVQVKMPNKIMISDEEFTVSVCGKYTYGEPVSGLATVNVCRKFTQNYGCYGKESESICEEFSKQVNGLGCMSQILKTKIFQLKRDELFQMSLQATAKITEDGTDVELTGTGSSEITEVLSKVSFVNVDSHYRHGLPFFGQVLLVDGKDAPIPNELVYIIIMESNSHNVKNYTTNAQGLVQFSFETDNYTSPSIRLSVKHKDDMECYGYMWKRAQYRMAQHTLKHVFSLSKSYIYIEPIFDTLTCGQNQNIQVHYILNPKTLEELKEVTFYYLVMAKGFIVQSGNHVLPVTPSNVKGIFPLTFLVESAIAPIARILVYTILPDGEIIADSKKFNVETCFANKVNLSFSSPKSLPSTVTHLKVIASPQSLCALRAVDESVLLQHPEKELTPNSLYELLSVKDLTGFPQGVKGHEEDSEKCVHFKNIFIDGVSYAPVMNNEEDDTYNFLKEMGLKVFTNAKVKKPHFCMPHTPPPAAYLEYGRAVPLVGAAGVGDLRHQARFRTNTVIVEEQKDSPVETVRKHFPETWIWSLVVPDSTGETEVEVNVPDTITKWKAGAFCLSDNTGFGLSPPTSLIAFKPFFVSLTLPYSVIRGEAFTLKATVFNYLPHCIRVKVQLKDSSMFVAVPKEKNEESHCICGSHHQTFSWAVTPKSLGKVAFSASAEAVESQEMCHNEKAIVPESGKKDTVIRDLLVEPEGIEKEEAFNSMLCPTDAELSEQISLKLPPNVVEGSARAYFSVLGDILGSAVQDTQNLLKMPYGCGEQNMARLAPNIYVLNYLNETLQLTPEIKAKAIGFLQHGYHQQLIYKHSDGSYSTFRHSESNTWLTAFVLKSFAQAQAHIFIDETHIKEALFWLSHQQKENGCFRSSGSLVHNDLKGGVEDELTLSAYITIALLEMPLEVTHSVVRNALFCLETAWKIQQNEVHKNSAYTKALLAYAFALAGNEARKKELLLALDKDAVKKDNSVHWERPVRPQAPAGFQSLAPSVEVEMTSYVLLAYLTALPAPSPEDMTMASQIVNWIAKQQNPHGGFSSTQDTVVALHALSRYGALTYSKHKEPTEVTFQSSKDFSQKFQVHPANLLLLQQISLPEVPGEYTAGVKGKRCVYLKTSLRYNVHVKEEDSPFHLQVQTIPPTCDSAKAHRTFQISFNVSYKGNRPSSNMVIIDVKMVSGFIPEKSSVKMLVKSGRLSKTEVTSNHVLLYVEKLTNETLSFSFTVNQDIPVRDLKPAVVKIYDYYETDEMGFAEYQVPCSTDSNQGNA